MSSACTCHLETDFGAVEGDTLGGSSPFEVIDAECEVVASCRSRAAAELIAWALNEMGKRGISQWTDAAGEQCIAPNTVCRLHWVSRGKAT